MSTLTLRAAPPERLDFLAINPLALSGLSQSEAERLEVGTSRTGVRLGDCFAVSLDGSKTLTIDGGTNVWTASAHPCRKARSGSSAMSASASAPGWSAAA